MIGIDDRLKRKIWLELGSAIQDALSDDGVVEIMLNQDGQIWVDRIGEGMSQAGEMSNVDAMALIGSLASSLGREVNDKTPVLEGELLIDQSRIQAVIPPIVSAPILTIRKRAIALFGLDDYVQKEILDTAQHLQIIEAVAKRKNIVVAGGTGSGKTTLVNAVIRSISDIHPNDRVVLIEDTLEIQCDVRNFVQLRTATNVSMNDLLRATMRLRPDRVLVGEVRGPEALTLCKAWNTGHPGGVCTLHANSCQEALVRLESLMAEAGVDSNTAQRLINAAVNLVIFIEKTGTGRKVSEVLSVNERH